MVNKKSTKSNRTNVQTVSHDIGELHINIFGQWIYNFLWEIS